MTSIAKTTFVQERNAYRLEYPAHWEHLSQDDGRSCGFGPRERDDVGLWITILPTTLDTDKIEDALPELFRQAIGAMMAANLRRDTTLRHFGLKADMAKEGEGGFFWILIGGDLVLFASSQVPIEQRDEWNPQFDAVMASLEITRGREHLQRKIADEVYARLCALQPDQAYRLEHEALLGRDRRVSLNALFRQVAAEPDRRKEIVDRFIDAFAAGNALGEEPLKDVRNRILPLLKPAEYLQSPECARLAFSEWIGDVVICYAIRSDQTRRLVTHWDLDRWKIAVNGLHKMAMDNLTRMPWPERMEGARQHGGRLILVSTGDSLDASRLLHPDLHRLLSEALGSPFYAGIPADDTLVAFSGGDPSFCLQMVRRIRSDHQQSASPITAQPFRITAGGIEVAQFPPYSE